MKKKSEERPCFGLSHKHALQGNLRLAGFGVFCRCGRAQAWGNETKGTYLITCRWRGDEVPIRAEIPTLSLDPGPCLDKGTKVRSSATCVTLKAALWVNPERQNKRPVARISPTLPNKGWFENPTLSLSVSQPTWARFHAAGGRQNVLSIWQ